MLVRVLRNDCLNIISSQLKNKVYFFIFSIFFVVEVLTVFIHSSSQFGEYHYDHYIEPFIK